MIIMSSLCKSFGITALNLVFGFGGGEILLILKARISTAMFPDILYFGVESFEGNECFI